MNGNQVLNDVSPLSTSFPVGKRPAKTRTNGKLAQLPRDRTRRGMWCYAAEPGYKVNAFPISCCVAPVAMSARTIRSSDTEGSPASIFAILDWLEPMRCARSVCERWRFLRDFLTASISDSFMSASVASCSSSPRKSFAVPTFQPAAFRRFSLAFRISGISDSVHIALYWRRRVVHVSITDFGAFAVVLENTSRMTIASAST